jgi:hypothetical protein
VASTGGITSTVNRAVVTTVPLYVKVAYGRVVKPNIALKGTRLFMAVLNVYFLSRFGGFV